MRRLTAQRGNGGPPHDLRLSCLAFLGVLTLVTTADADVKPALALESTIVLGDVRGRIDHLALDPVRHRLYVAELGNDSIGVVDLNGRDASRTIGGFDEPQGIAYEPVTDTVYVANGGDGSVTVLNGADLSRLSTVVLGTDADNVRVDTVRQRVIVGYGRGALAVLAALDRRRISDIELDDHPEGFALAPDGRRIFVNLPAAREIAVVDAVTGEWMANWTTGSLESNFPIAIAEQRILAAFRHPPTLAAFNMSDGSLIASTATCADADDLLIDAKRGRVYVICGEGFIDVLATDDGKFMQTGRIATSSGARTALFDAEHDRLYLAVRAKPKERAAIWIYRPD